MGLKTRFGSCILWWKSSCSVNSYFWVGVGKNSEIPTPAEFQQGSEFLKLGVGVTPTPLVRVVQLKKQKTKILLPFLLLLRSKKEKSILFFVCLSTSLSVTVNPPVFCLFFAFLCLRLYSIFSSPSFMFFEYFLFFFHGVV